MFGSVAGIVLSSVAAHAVLSFSTAVAAGASAETPVDWKGKRVTLEAAGLADDPAVVALAPWTKAHGYALAASDDLRLVVCAKAGAGRALQRGERVLAHADELFGGRSPEAAFVALEIAHDDDFASLCDALGAHFPTYTSWFASVRGATGFVLPEPGIAAHVAKPKGIKPNEWHAENELVHRVAALELHARFGRLPYWLEAGFAWRAEFALEKDVYCFPGRDGFVAVGEHKGWAAKLAAEGKARLEQSFEYAELTGLPRGGFDADLARRAFGTFDYLARHRRAELVTLCAELSAARERGARITHADGTWETKPNWEVPRDEERELVLALVQRDFCAEVTRFFAAGASFRPKAPR
ncbi:MAG: hypothetical protein L6Q99_00980 [Planctomycetes bacterium]|nr:hypothetical protein [Planctomycetota bacterium]